MYTPFASMTSPLGNIKEEFEELYNQTTAAGGEVIDVKGAIFDMEVLDMTEDFNFPWLAIGSDVSYDMWYDGGPAYNKPCETGCEACGWKDSSFKSNETGERK